MELKSTWEDYYFPDPGKVETANCGICGDEMWVNRDCDGPTSFVMSLIGKSSRKHDAFFCHHKDEKWHKQVKALNKLAKQTPSPELEQLYLNEANIILSLRQCTKPNWEAI